MLLCDYHKALEEFRLLENVDDTHKFDLTSFIQRIDWNKVRNSCQPELAMLFRGFKRVNEDIGRRVV